MFTSLYLTKVFPASTPSADLKTIVIVGPSLMMRWMAIPIATTAANIGMIQTMEIRVCLLGTTVACGKLLRSVLSAMLVYPIQSRIPDEARVERLSSNHRQHNYSREKQYPRPRRDRHQRRELHQGNCERVDEHIEHRPAADKFDQSIQSGSFAITTQ